MMRETVGIIDYGSGNFASVWNAFEKHGCQLEVITQSSQLDACSHIVLPGVGAFSTAMKRLHEMELVQPLQEVFAAKKKPFLGICVGMQILAQHGTEFEPTEGLGAIDGAVDRFDFTNVTNPPRLPHMGWNDVLDGDSSTLLAGVDLDDPSFYFVHSFHLRSGDAEARFYSCDYGYRFIAAVEKNRVFGVQFHPEKSQRNGAQLIRNFLSVTHG